MSDTTVTINITLPDNLQANAPGGTQGAQTQTPAATPGVPQKLVDEAEKSMAQAREQQAELFKMAFKPLPPRPQEPDVAKLLNINPADDAGKMEQRTALISTLTGGHSKHGGAGMGEVRALDGALAELGKITTGPQYHAIASELFQKYAEPVRRTDNFWQHGGTNGILKAFRSEVEAKINEIKKPFMQEFATQKTAYNDAAVERNRALQALGLPTYNLASLTGSASGITQPMGPIAFMMPTPRLEPVLAGSASRVEREEAANAPLLGGRPSARLSA